MNSFSDLSAALNLYEESARNHAIATEEGDYMTGNRCYEKIQKVFEYLKESRELLALEKFLDHESIGVRIWAASHLLQIQHKEAVRVLENISKRLELGIHSLTAETTLNEWREGNLQA